MSAALRLATAAYPLDRLPNFEAFAAKRAAWVAEAAGAGAGLLLFPEYAEMELAGWDKRAGDLQASAGAVAERAAQSDDLHRALARRFGVTIVSGSGPVAPSGGGALRNAARVFAPGADAAQEKLIPTVFERGWGIAPGEALVPMALGPLTLGVLVCYDVEFPLLARALVDAGAVLLLVPSCTDAPAGYHRVRVGAMARALEGQCVVAQAVTLGDAPWCPAVDTNHGRAGVFAPPDLGFPETGILAEGAMDTPGWVYADVDPARVEAVRAKGQVRNRAHWPEQRAGARNLVPARLLP